MKSTTVSIVIAGIIIAGAIILSRNISNNNCVGNVCNTNAQTEEKTNPNNVSVVNGKQIIEINVKGGYQPRISIAKAGIPTTIRFDTNGVFDCSGSIRIPSMNILKALPQSGSTDIDIGTSTVTTLNGTCGMGMYSFEVEFK